MGSKLWLCHEVERIKFTRPQTVWILGGWCGLMAQLLFTRERVPLTAVRSFDVDPSCEPRADLLNNLWVWREWKFKAFTVDCGKLDYAQPGQWASTAPHIVINTSTEHFSSLDWWHKIPAHTLCVLQSNNMPHDDHIFGMKSVDQMAQTFGMRKILFQGTLDFDYRNHTSFQRYMLLGYK